MIDLGDEKDVNSIPDEKRAEGDRVSSGGHYRIDSEGYADWWRLSVNPSDAAIDLEIRKVTAQEAPAVVSGPRILRQVPLGTKRIWVGRPDAPPVETYVRDAQFYQGTPNITLPLFRRSPDGHLGAIDS